MPTPATATPVAAPLPPAPDYSEPGKAVAQFESDSAALKAQRESAIAPVEQQIKQIGTDIDRAASEPAKSMPLPDNLAKHLDPKQMNEAASVWMTMGALAGLLSRAPMTAALGNMTAAMKGVHEGDAEQYDRASAEFKTNLDKALKYNKEQIDAKEKVLKDKNLSLTAKMREWDMIDAKYGNQASRALEQSLKGRLQTHEANVKAYESAVRAQQQWTSLEERIRHNRVVESTRRGGGGGVKSSALGGASGPTEGDAAVRFWAQAVIAGDKDWQVGLSRSKGGADLIEKVKRMVPVMAAEMGLKPQDIGTERAKSAALQTTLKDLTKRAEAIDLFSGKIEKDMKTLDGLLDSASTDIAQFANKPINWIRRQTSDPKLAQLDLAAKQVGVEYERLITGGTLSVAQLHAGAQEDAKKLINGDMTPEQARAVMDIMRVEMRNAKEAAHESRARITDQMRNLGQARNAPGSAVAPPAGFKVLD